MNISIWDQRYATEEYVYGTEPNLFFHDELGKLNPGKLLLPAEGEGRNAVFAATRGWKVTAFDNSIEAQKKAFRLAEQFDVEIQYLHAGYDHVLLAKDYFDCIAMIYAHGSPIDRTHRHRRMLEYLKPGGKFILEGFSKAQIVNNTGGPKDVKMLFSVDELEYDFKNLKNLSVTSLEIDLQEGLFHNGKANIIRLTGTK